MGATARIVVLMSPEEKASLDAKAQSSGGISAGELVRRAVAAYDEADQAEAAELKSLLELFLVTHQTTLRRLDDSERKLDETLDYLAGVR